MFSFYLSDQTNGGSQLYLGGYDTTKFSGNIYWNPVVNKGYWQIGSGSAFANNKATTATGFQTIVDTGTTLIYAVGSAFPFMRYTTSRTDIPRCVSSPTQPSQRSSLAYQALNTGATATGLHHALPSPPSHSSSTTDLCSASLRLI